MIFLWYNIKNDVKRMNILKRSNTYNLVMASIMAAFVLLTTFMGITVPIGGTNIAFHLGNITCLLSGVLLGPVYGGFASAIGSAIFDILNPIYITSLPFTFVFKFIMTFICGTIAYSNNKNGEDYLYNIVGATTGSLVYMGLRSIKALVINLYFLDMEPLTALLFMLSGLIVAVLKTAFTVGAVAVLFPIMKEKLNSRKLQ